MNKGMPWHLPVYHGSCVASTAEAVLQEMDNITSIRQNRELERLRMWNGDTEEVSVILALFDK